MSLVDTLYRLGKAARNYRNPLGLLAQRTLARPRVEVTDRLTGLSFQCLRGADRMMGEIFHTRVYDVPVAPVRPGDVVIDVGANHGFAACWFAHRGARVVAFEPSPEVFALLQSNIADNGLGDRITAFQEAVSDREGTATLLVTPALGGGMSTLDPRFAERLSLPVTGRPEVRTRTLPAVLRELDLGRIRLLKLDCEGSELAILRSLDPATLERIDSLAIEYHPDSYALSDLLGVVLGWGIFHVSKVSPLDVENANLHAVSRRALEEWAAGPLAASESCG
jgi:FkbM family methyltransferase